MERGVITAISPRGRVLVRHGTRIVVADIQSGGGGWIGDEVEGDLRVGLRTFRHVGTGALSIVYVIGAPSSVAVAEEMLVAV